MRRSLLSRSYGGLPPQQGQNRQGLHQSVSRPDCFALNRSLRLVSAARILVEQVSNFQANSQLLISRETKSSMQTDLQVGVYGNERVLAACSTSARPVGALRQPSLTGV